MSAPIDRLSPLDATFLHVEDSVTHMHVGSIGILEGPSPPHDTVLATVAVKLEQVPRLRQKVCFLPLAAGRPVWVDDEHFDLGYHLRRTTLPAPGGEAELLRLVGRLMSVQLDRARPLWEMWTVEGLDDGRWAVVFKLHHCMVDGVSASSLITGLMDVTSDGGSPAAPAPWTPTRGPGAAGLVAGALAERARWPLRLARAGADAVRDPGAAATRVAATAQGAAGFAQVLRPPPTTSLNGPVGPHRRWDLARGRLDEVRRIRTAFGGTVNDVVLAAIAGGFRELLEGRGEPPERALRTLVPVSVRTREHDGTYANRVSAIIAELPVTIEGPVARLHAVSAQMRGLKASHEADAGEVFTALGGFAPELALSWGGRLATRMPQRTVNTVTTNVPGPQQPLYLAGRRLLETFPYVPLGGHVRIGVAIYSYDGALAFGVTGDADTASDLGVLCAGIERELAELLESAEEVPTADGGMVAAGSGSDTLAEIRIEAGEPT